MKTTLTLTNEKIYEIAAKLVQFQETDVTLPVKVNFYLQKNIQTMIELGKEIEQARVDIFEKYGTVDEEKQQYVFESDTIEIVTKEIEDLMSLTQDIEIYFISLDAFENIELSSSQVSAISFMIEESDI